MKSTKDKIIDALATLIKNDEDIKNISISKIAELANIGKSTVYEHFASKKELMVETYQFLVHYYCEKIMAPIEASSFEQAYKTITRRIFRYALEASELMMSILSNGQSFKLMHDDAIKQVMNEAQDQIQTTYIDILKMGVAEGVIHASLKEEKEKGHVIKALTMGLMMLRINKHIDLDEDDAVNYLYKYTVLALNA